MVRKLNLIQNCDWRTIFRQSQSFFSRNSKFTCNGSDSKLSNILDGFQSFIFSGIPNSQRSPIGEVRLVNSKRFVLSNRMPNMQIRMRIFFTCQTSCGLLLLSRMIENWEDRHVHFSLRLADKIEISRIVFETSANIETGQCHCIFELLDVSFGF